jgi:enterochelin esterase-like enzyme
VAGGTAEAERILRAPMQVTTQRGPRVGDDAVEFELTDARLTGVALLHELRRPRRLPFTRSGRTFRLRYLRPEADRFEYVLELTRRDGRTELVPDPTNPLRAPGPFGEKSVVEFPDYAAPGWVLDDDSARGDVRELPLRSRLGRVVPALLWSAAETDPRSPLPLLVVHDGPEYSRYASLLRLLDHLVDTGETPEFRALLLPPGPGRNELYSASTRYANALAADLLPRAAEQAPVAGQPAFLGASLGALAGVHAHFRYPGLFGGIFLQSGSFFQQRLDAHESGFARFARVTRFVGQVRGLATSAAPVPTVITCGTAEENLANNRDLAAALELRGWRVTTYWNRDAHNWTAWRDALQPHLADLLLRAWT